jgi:homoserine acetyltransferase
LEQALDCDCNETTAREVAGMISHLALYSPDFHARQDPHDQGAALLKDGRAGGMTLAINDRVAQLQAMIAHDVSTSFDGKWPATAEAVKAEMLAVVGTYDHMVTPGPALTFAELTNSQTLVLDNDCGHQSFRCEQDRAFEEIRAFLSTP